MPANLPDDVLAAARDGDSAALTEIYSCLAPAVFGYLTARGVSDPEGLTSEVFLAVFPRIGVVTGGFAGLRTFVFSVAHARMVDDIRRRRRQPDIVAYDPGLDRRLSMSAEQESLLHEDEAVALRLLATLPADQAEVVTLRVLADLSLEQTAQVMGRSTGAVKQLQRRGLLALRRALSSQGVTR